MPLSRPWFATFAAFLTTAVALLAAEKRIAPTAESNPADAVITGRAEPPADVMAWWYRSPAASFWEGLPIGNGRFAAMVYGRVRDEIIPFNDETLWTGRPNDPVNPAGRKALPEIRRLALAGDFVAASNEAEKLLSYPFPHVQTYQAMARLHVRFEGHDTVQDYRRELDLDTAIARITYRIGDAHYTREVFASQPDQVVVLRITCDRPGRLTLNASLSSLHPSAVARTDGDSGLSMAGGVKQTSPDVPSEMRWEGAIRVLADGGGVRADNDGTGPSVRVEHANAVTILLAGATNFESWDRLGADPHARCNAYLERAQTRSFADLRHRHLVDYAPQFNACRLDLGGTAAARDDTTTRLERLRKGGEDPLFTAQYFQYGRYLLLAGSRPGGLAFNNHNKWLDDLEGRWRGRWTLNINLQECYWCAETANLPGTVEPFLTFMEMLAASGARTAKELYGCDGWCAHHGTDIWMNTAPTDDIRHGMTPLMGVWLVQTLWEHFEFDPDPQYLRKIYPLLKGATQFGRDYLIEEPTHHWLVTCPSASPENAFLLPDGKTLSALSVGPAMDEELLRDVFREFITASTVLGCDEAMRNDIARALPRLAPLQIGSRGQLLEWMREYPEFEPKHRHTSHLYALYPSNEITPRDTPALAAAARKSLELRGDNRGWSAAWKINLWARLGDAETAYRTLRRMETEISIHPQMEDSDRVPSIEGNQGVQAYTAGIVEILLQSHAGYIELLPALPAAWPSGAIRGVRARGDFTVDLAWRDGRLATATLQAKYARPCRLRLPPGAEVRTNGRPVTTREVAPGVVEFATVAGGMYEIAPR